MKRFVEGEGRTQVTLLPECELGFMRAEPASTGRDFEDRLLHIAHEHAQAQRK